MNKRKDIRPGSASKEGVSDEGFPMITVWAFYNILTWYITHKAVSLNHRVTMEERLRKAMVHFGRACRVEEGS